jgi:hypothetical protein
MLSCHLPRAPEWLHLAALEDGPRAPKFIRRERTVVVICGAKKRIALEQTHASHARDRDGF